ncbi:hypothetical protein ACQKGO_24005 [Corallococcus interemptor]|uniref:hypothetical protein n=1 Tax=Corallococcus interemptor TaxID=2316720 RepID=UPI003D07D9BF
MIEALEKCIPHVIAALTRAGLDVLTVKELRGRIGSGEQSTRRALTLVLAACEV